MLDSDFPFTYTANKILLKPIYLGLVDAILLAIHEGNLTKGQRLPSINAMSEHYRISRSTIEKAYNELGNHGLIKSYPGKGFFVTWEKNERNRRVLLMFNAFNSYQKIIFDTFSRIMAVDTIIEMVVYNSDPILFKQLMHQRKNKYSYYLIIPEFLGDSTKAWSIINNLPKDKVVLIYDRSNKVSQADE